MAELNNNGQKTKGYIYAGGRKLAQEVGGNVTWSHEEPVTASRGNSSLSGAYAPSAEFNADGVNTGLEDPALHASDIPGLSFDWPEFGLSSRCSSANPNCTTCYLDGFEHDCSEVEHLLERDFATPCPNNDCGPRSVVYQGERTWALFNAYGDG